VETESYAIALIAMLASVIGAFLYLRIMVSVWLEDEESTTEIPRVPFLTGATVAVSAAFTLVIGFAPGWLLDTTRQVIQLAGR
jgi:NADH-quinone oxidoreductase subunit N